MAHEHEGEATGTTPLGVAVAEVRRAVSTTREVLREAGDVPEADLLAGLAAVSRLRSGLEAAYLAVVREVDARGLGRSATSRTGASTLESLVRSATGASASAARRDVAAARATARGEALEGFDVPLTTGEVSREHVDVAVRVMDRIPSHLTADDDARETVASFLRECAVESHAGPRELDRASRQLLARLDPDGTDTLDPRAHDRRFLDMGTDATGMLVGRFQLDSVSGAALKVAVDAHSAPVASTAGVHRADRDDGGDGSAGTGDPDATRDPRSARQRRADALVTIVELALGVTTPRRGERPRVVVHTTADQLASHSSAPEPGSGAGPLARPARGDGAPPARQRCHGLATTESGDVLSSAALARLACDAVLQRVVVGPSLGPLDVGREQRLVTPAQRRALAVRDGGCVVCQLPPNWCDAHHIVPWGDGGPTDLDNLALLCPSHHTAAHAGVWQLTIDEQDGLMVVPPAWVDPLRRPRPPTHQAIERALERWRLAAPRPGDEPDEPPPDDGSSDKPHDE